MCVRARVCVCARKLKGNHSRGNRVRAFKGNHRTTAAECEQTTHHFIIDNIVCERGRGEQQRQQRARRGGNHGATTFCDASLRCPLNPKPIVG
eukprot:11483106-Alexandrium_andersonii.AAC.1